MSASAELQSAISTLLGQRGTTVLGDGAATVIALTHGLGMLYLPAVWIMEDAAVVAATGVEKSTTLVLAASSGSAVEGAAIKGAHVPARTTITKVAGTTLTLSAALTGAVSEVTLGRVLVRGVDYDLNPAIEDPTNALKVTAKLGAPAAGAWTATIGRLSVDVPIVQMREKDLPAIAAAAANHGLCIQVIVPMPTKTGTPGKKTIFFDGVDVRCRIMEQPPLNRFEINRYELAEEVQKGLHYQRPALLTHPLYVAQKPLEASLVRVEGSNQATAILDVIFNAAYGFTTPPALGGDAPGRATADSTLFTADTTNLTADSTL